MHEQLSESTIAVLRTLGHTEEEIALLVRKGEDDDEIDETEKHAWAIAVKDAAAIAHKAGLDSVAIKAAMRPFVEKALHAYAPRLAALDAQIDALGQELIRVKRMHAL